MPTIKDVAKLAGVAPSTVSHYFTGNARVKPETCRRIEKAIDQLQYRPNLVARSLRLQHTQTIGLIVPDIANPFFAEIVQAIGHASQQMGYALLLADSGNDSGRERNLLESMFEQHIDGLLYIHAGHDNSDHTTALHNPPKPVVFVDRDVSGQPSVATDNYAGGRLAARHLVGLGHRRIGIIAGDRHVRNVQQRLEGFQFELEQHNIKINGKHVITGTQSFETGLDIQLLMISPEPPTAIFATNDIIAVGAWHKLNDMGLRVPDDVSLIGYDDIFMSQWTIPPLTTIRQDKRELGRQSVAALIRAIQTKDLAVATIHIPPTLIIRNSTAQPASTTDRAVPDASAI